MENVIEMEQNIVIENITGNAKRIASCKKVGGEKKAKGHKRENDFKKQYNPGSLDDPTEYGATSDTTILASSHIFATLSCKFDFIDVAELNCSNKSGNNLQFTLGKIPELSEDNNLDWVSEPANCKLLFNKYLKKCESKKPADLLVYKDNDNKKWIFFKMDDIVDFIVDSVKWRKLESGRLKGDFEDGSKKGVAQYLTYEYRTNHKSYFLGLNGGKGICFMKLLMKKINYFEDDFNY